MFEECNVKYLANTMWSKAQRSTLLASRCQSLGTIIGTSHYPGATSWKIPETKHCFLWGKSDKDDTVILGFVWPSLDSSFLGCTCVCVFAHCGGNEITFRACPQLKHICCNDVPSSWCFLQKVSEDARSESWFKLSQFSQPEGVSEFWSPGPDYPCWRWHGPIPSLANTTSCRQWEQHGKATW